MKKSFYLTCLLFMFSAIGTASNEPQTEQIWYSQASQDAFVYTVLVGIEKKEDKGYYLEIGSAHPTVINNSYFLEKNLGWEGVSVDVAPEYKNPWAEKRSNPLYVQDAMRTDYSSLLKSFPKEIDYLSLDVDGYYGTVLKQIPFDQYSFKVITIEHDFYRFGEVFRQEEREILSALGYYLLCPDVLHPAVGSFEDWWIYPPAFSAEGWAKLSSLDLQQKYHYEIVAILRNISDGVIQSEEN
jgi:hypothetical protein